MKFLSTNFVKLGVDINGINHSKRFVAIMTNNNRPIQDTSTVDSQAAEKRGVLGKVQNLSRLLGSMPALEKIWEMAWDPCVQEGDQWGGVSIMM